MQVRQTLQRVHATEKVKTPWFRVSEVLNPSPNSPCAQLVKQARDVPLNGSLRQDGTTRYNTIKMADFHITRILLQYKPINPQANDLYAVLNNSDDIPLR